jgi:hypothetical protein
VLLLQEFDLEIWDKKGNESLIVDHLSKIDRNMNGGVEKVLINEEFIDEHLYSMHIDATH